MLMTDYAYFKMLVKNIVQISNLSSELQESVDCDLKYAFNHPISWDNIFNNHNVTSPFALITMGWPHKFFALRLLHPFVGSRALSETAVCSLNVFLKCTSNKRILLTHSYWLLVLTHFSQ